MASAHQTTAMMMMMMSHVGLRLCKITVWLVSVRFIFAFLGSQRIHLTKIVYSTRAQWKTNRFKSIIRNFRMLAVKWPLFFLDVREFILFVMCLSFVFDWCCCCCAARIYSSKEPDCGGCMQYVKRVRGIKCCYGKEDGGCGKVKVFQANQRGRLMHFHP